MFDVLIFLIYSKKIEIEHDQRKIHSKKWCTIIFSRLNEVYLRKSSNVEWPESGSITSAEVTNCSARSKGYYFNCLHQVERDYSDRQFHDISYTPDPLNLFFALSRKEED